MIMKETFTFSPRIEPTGSMNFRALRAQFGDGYAQTAGDGLNSARQAWPLEFVGDETKIRAIKDFLDRHGGHKPFLWTAPMSDEASYVLQDGYQLAALGRGYFRLTATFEQVFTP